jgi:hypothetical protein
MQTDEKLEQILKGIDDHFFAKYGLRLETHEIRNLLFPASQRALQEEMANTVGPSNVIDFMQFLERKLYGHLLEEKKQELQQENKTADVLDLKKSTSQKKKKDV